MARTDKDVVVGMDIGTSGIAVAIMGFGFGLKHELLGVGYSPLFGIEKGIVTSVDDAVGSVKRAIADAELAVGVDIHEVLASADIPGMMVCKSSIRQKTGGRQGISQRDLFQARNNLCALMARDGLATIQLTEIRCCVNGAPLLNPIGHRCGEFEYKATAWLASENHVEQFRECLRKANLKVRYFLAGPAATVEAVLGGAERELGVICVDIGYGLTKVAYVNHGFVRNMDVFPVGSSHITADLAVGLHINLELAESIKIKYGLNKINDHVGVQSLSRLGECRVPGNFIHSITRSRVEEILDFVKSFIDRLSLGGYLPGGVVITGGGSKLVGLRETAEGWLGMPVRGETGRMITDSLPEDDAYKYTTAVGLVLWGTRQKTVRDKMKRRTEGGIFHRIRNWL